MCNKDNDIQNLTGVILLSAPMIPNGYLQKSVIYICSHDKNGAMGIVINKIIPNINIPKILKELNIKMDAIETLNIHFGGSEESEHCFILHSNDYLASNSKIISNNIALTVNDDVLRVVTSIGGPVKKVLCMGCCIWEPEQLENEVASNYWVPIDADEALIFGDSRQNKWTKALFKIGSSTNVFLDSSGSA